LFHAIRRNRNFAPVFLLFLTLLSMNSPGPGKPVPETLKRKRGHSDLAYVTPAQVRHLDSRQVAG